MYILSQKWPTAYVSSGFDVYTKPLFMVYLLIATVYKVYFLMCGLLLFNSDTFNVCVLLY